MCGIMGYIGSQNATRIILDGLKRLEYRGYDSAGIAVAGNTGIAIKRTEGKLGNLEALLADTELKGTSGIGHTRWATHGRPSERNAHPHRAGDVVVVHNGIIENYLELKKFLTAEGQKFKSETDTEAICQLVDYYFRANGGKMLEAVRSTIAKLRGSYAVVIMNAKDPNCIYVARRGTPLVVGEANGERFVASDIPALLPYTKDMVFLEDGDFAMVCRKGISIFDIDGKSIERRPNHIPWTPLMAEKGGYKHFMLKEIFEQAQVIEDVITGRIDSGNGAIVLDDVEALFATGASKFENIVIAACGTSLHAAMVGKYVIENLTKLPVSVDYASEFRYREPILDPKTLIVPISQSGETADTLAALRLAKEAGCKAMAICNVVGSTITRESDATLYTHAGPEIGVASTKAFTAQLAALYLFGLYIAQKLGTIGAEDLSKHISELLALPRQIADCLKGSAKVRRIAVKIADQPNVFFIGRGTNFPVALEGALKLKEISYVHAEGFAAGELKHGPIALIDNGVPVVAIMPKGPTYEKVLSNLEEVKARGAYTVAVAFSDDDSIRDKVDDVIAIPQAGRFITPILASIPLQLLAYYVADHKGTDVDQPRNLAKSVTVE